MLLRTLPGVLASMREHVDDVLVERHAAQGRARPRCRDAMTLDRAARGRRNVWTWIAAIAIGGIAEVALAQPRADGLYAATYVAGASAGTVAVPLGSSIAHARLGRALPPPLASTLVAIDTPNQTYELTATYRGPGCRTVVLVLGGAPVRSGGTSEGRGRCTHSFWLTREEADRAEQLLGVARIDRAPIGVELEARFTARATYARGERIEVRVSLHSPPGTDPVRRMVGCCRLSWSIHRDGRRVSEHRCAATDEACPIAFVDLAPGSLDAPGHYRIELRYQTELAAGGAPAQALPASRAEVWDRTFDGVVELDVR
jgi:hypothetical protein